ncbi:sodium:calcium antiporter [Thermithiobacillus plumbiphilus]|uniref:Sodium:calcium antiporter n=1 Tax=Thermithiobacillus plumbiphilus TaxID=1729899 RepID=A0ABU9D950_9PROT
MDFLTLFISLIVILLGAEAFTNALEHLGERLKISEGVTGSLFAAVGTALPEAMVPIIAVLGGAASDPRVGEEVGVGAILGAPMMLSTLSLFLMAYFAARKRGWNGSFKPEPTGFQRDLTWFLAAFSLGTAAMFIPFEQKLIRGSIGISLILMYFFYIMLTLRASASLVEEGHGTEAGKPLFLNKVRLPENMPVIILQLLLGFGLIIGGAHGFVSGIEHISVLFGLSALALSLLIIPVATELPEKVNSILWIRRGKDTLAFGNITGAMVFQGSILPAMGIMLTPWQPSPDVLLGAGLTLLASIWLFIMHRRGTLRPYHLVFNGLCYVAYFSVLVQ